MGFAYEEQEQIIEVIRDWFSQHVGEENIRDLQFRVGSEAIRYSEYASPDNVWMAMDGSIILHFLYYGEDGWKLRNTFDNFLDEVGLWFEFNHHWDCSFYASESPESTMKLINSYKGKAHV